MKPVLLKPLLPQAESVSIPVENLDRVPPLFAEVKGLFPKTDPGPELLNPTRRFRTEGLAELYPEPISDHYFDFSPAWQSLSRHDSWY